MEQSATIIATYPKQHKNCISLFRWSLNFCFYFITHADDSRGSISSIGVCHTLYRVAQKTGPSISHCKYSENSMAELRTIEHQRILKMLTRKKQWLLRVTALPAGRAITHYHKRKHFPIAIHVVQKITIIRAHQKIGKFAVWNLILCTGAIWRRREKFEIGCTTIIPYKLPKYFLLHGLINFRWAQTLAQRALY